MRFLEIMRTFKEDITAEAQARLFSDFRAEVFQTLKTLRHNNTTRAAAVKSYKGYIPEHLAKIQDDDNGLYTDGFSALSVNVKGAKYDDNNAIVKHFKNIFEHKQRAELRDSIDYSIAIAKNNGWRIGDTDHYIIVNDCYYNLSLVARAFNCIADNKVFNDCDIWQQTDTKYKALLLSSKYGMALVLPFAAPGNLTYNVTPGDGLVDDLEKVNDNKLMEAIA